MEPRSLSGPVGELPPPAAPSELARSAESSESLQLVRNFAERVREAQKRANAEVSDARDAARRAILAMMKAEQRATEAETQLTVALARADDAEEQLRLLKSQRGDEAKVGTDVDQWLNDAYLKLRLETEKRDEDNWG